MTQDISRQDKLAARDFITKVAKEDDGMPHWMPVAPNSFMQVNMVGSTPEEGMDITSAMPEHKKFVAAMAQNVTSGFVQAMGNLLKRYRPLYKHGMEEPRISSSTSDGQHFMICVMMEEGLQRKIAQTILADTARRR